MLHIGTHKTATTLLQNFLQWNATTLTDAGLYFPCVGWYGVVPGQHAVAWELLDGGDTAQTDRLIDDLTVATAPHVIISSEEFSLLFDRPAALRVLVERIRAVGYDAKVLVYLRAQPAFAESMYAERIKHGDIRLFSPFIGEILQHGGFEARGRRVTVQSSELLDAFKRATGHENVHVRQYTGGGDAVTIVHDFLAALATLVPCFDPRNLRLDLHRTRMNESLSFGHLLGTAFVQLFPDIGLPANPEEFIGQHVPSLPRDLFNKRFSLLHREEYIGFLERFADDNHRVRSRYGMSAAFLNDADIPAADDPRWTIASIERPILDACVSQWLERANRAVGYRA